MSVDAGDVRDAGADGLSVQQHRACAALRQSAAESRAVEFEIFLQYEQQGSRWVVNGDCGTLPIDLKSISSHTRYPPSWDELGIICVKIPSVNWKTKLSKKLSDKEDSVRRDAVGSRPGRQRITQAALFPANPQTSDWSLRVAPSLGGIVNEEQRSA